MVTTKAYQLASPNHNSLIKQSSKVLFFFSVFLPNRSAALNLNTTTALAAYSPFSNITYDSPGHGHMELEGGGTDDSLTATFKPTPKPTAKPSPGPTPLPTPGPTPKPTAGPTPGPTPSPSAGPTPGPTPSPSAEPTIKPSPLPSSQPSSKPSQQPISRPSSRPSSQPSSQPSLKPTAQPSSVPSGQPSSEPSAQPNAAPSAQPSDDPSSQPSGAPSGQPSGDPSSQPNAAPSGQPSAKPSVQPSAKPSAQPNAAPSTQPSAKPSLQPISWPTSVPSRQPSSRPSRQPSAKPSAQPSAKPSAQPNAVPSTQPSAQPSGQPSGKPSAQPSGVPSMQPFGKPSTQPSGAPSGQPSRQPSSRPTFQPTITPSGQPSVAPSTQPTSFPSRQPSAKPSAIPSGSPSAQPSAQPSSEPSGGSTSQPTTQPSSKPSSQPSSLPTALPSGLPSARPTAFPTALPSRTPTSQPSTQPTGEPTTQPSGQPSNQPSKQPSSTPTAQPTGDPSADPTSQPSNTPSVQPTAVPSTQPSSDPTAQPSRFPSVIPTSEPSGQPTSAPSTQPLSDPTAQPSQSPSVSPTSGPSGQPTSAPSSQPSSNPTAQPSSAPNALPSGIPSAQPAAAPSARPSAIPSLVPSPVPTPAPTPGPTTSPTEGPTQDPTAFPSEDPTQNPTLDPTLSPSERPSKDPTPGPTASPSEVPSLAQTANSTQAPTQNSDFLGQMWDDVQKNKKSLMLAGVGVSGVAVGGYVGYSRYAAYQQYKANAQVAPEPMEPVINTGAAAGEEEQESLLIYNRDEDKLIKFTSKKQLQSYYTYLGSHEKLLSAIHNKTDLARFNKAKKFIEEASSSLAEYESRVVQNSEQFEEFNLTLAESGFSEAERNNIKDFIRANADATFREEFYQQHYGNPPQALIKNHEYFIADNGNLELFENITDFDPNFHQFDENHEKVIHKAGLRMGDRSSFFVVEEEDENQQKVQKQKIYDSKPVSHYLDFSRFRETPLLNKTYQEAEPVCLIDWQQRLLQFESQEQLNHFVSEVNFFENSLQKLPLESAENLRNLRQKIEETAAAKYENHQQRLEALNAVNIDENLFANLSAEEGTRIKEFLSSWKNENLGKRAPKIAKKDVDYTINEAGNIVVFENLTRFNPDLHEIGEDRHFARYKNSGKNAIFYIEKNPETNRDTYYVFEAKEFRENFAHLMPANETNPEISIRLERPLDPLYLLNGANSFLEFGEDKDFQDYSRHMNFFEDEILNHLLLQGVDQQKIRDLRGFKASIKKPNEEFITGRIEEFREALGDEKHERLKQLLLITGADTKDESFKEYYTKYCGNPPQIKRQDELNFNKHRVFRINIAEDGTQSLTKYEYQKPKPIYVFGLDKELMRFESEEHFKKYDANLNFRLNSPDHENVEFEPKPTLLRRGIDYRINDIDNVLILHTNQRTSENGTLAYEEVTIKDGFLSYQKMTAENGATQAVTISTDYKEPQKFHLLHGEVLLEFKSNDQFQSYTQHINYLPELISKINDLDSPDQELYLNSLMNNQDSSTRKIFEKLLEELVVALDANNSDKIAVAVANLKNSPEITRVLSALNEQKKFDDFLAQAVDEKKRAGFFKDYYGESPTVTQYEMRRGDLLIEHQDGGFIKEEVPSYFVYEKETNQILLVDNQKPKPRYFVEGNTLYEFSDNTALDNFIDHKNGKISLDQLLDWNASNGDPEKEVAYRKKYNLAAAANYTEGQDFSYDQNGNLIVFKNFREPEPGSYVLTISETEKTLQQGEKTYHYFVEKGSDGADKIIIYDEEVVTAGHYRSDNINNVEFREYHDSEIYLIDPKGVLLKFSDRGHYEKYVGYNNYFNGFCERVSNQITAENNAKTDIESRVDNYAQEFGEAVKKWLIDNQHEIDSEIITAEEMAEQFNKPTTVLGSAYNFFIKPFFGTKQVAPEKAEKITVKTIEDFEWLTTAKKLQFIFQSADLGEDEKTQFRKFLEIQNPKNGTELRDSYLAKYHGINPPQVVSQAVSDGRNGLIIFNNGEKEHVKKYYHFDESGQVKQYVGEDMPPFYFQGYDQKLLRFENKKSYEEYAAYRNYPASLVQGMRDKSLLDGVKLGELIAEIEERKQGLSNEAEIRDLVAKSWDKISALLEKHDCNLEHLQDYLCAGSNDQTYYRKHFGVPPKEVESRNFTTDDLGNLTVNGTQVDYYYQQDAFGGVSKIDAVSHDPQFRFENNELQRFENQRHLMQHNGYLEYPQKIITDLSRFIPEKYSAAEFQALSGLAAFINNPQENLGTEDKKIALDLLSHHLNDGQFNKLSDYIDSLENPQQQAEFYRKHVYPELPRTVGYEVVEGKVVTKDGEQVDDEELTQKIIDEQKKIKQLEEEAKLRTLKAKRAKIKSNQLVRNMVKSIEESSIKKVTAKTTKVTDEVMPFSEPEEEKTAENDTPSIPVQIPSSPISKKRPNTTGSNRGVTPTRSSLLRLSSANKSKLGASIADNLQDIFPEEAPANLASKDFKEIYDLEPNVLRKLEEEAERHSSVASPAKETTRPTSAKFESYSSSKGSPKVGGEAISIYNRPDSPRYERAATAGQKSRPRPDQKSESTNNDFRSSSPRPRQTALSVARASIAVKKSAENTGEPTHLGIPTFFTNTSRAQTAGSNNRPKPTTTKSPAERQVRFDDNLNFGDEEIRPAEIESANPAIKTDNTKVAWGSPQKDSPNTVTEKLSPTPNSSTRPQSRQGTPSYTRLANKTDQKINSNK